MEALTTLQAAQLLGLTRIRVIQCIHERKIQAVKWGRQWAIRPEVLYRYMKLREGDYAKE
jgi:excisionase family DNA binding protein